MSEQKKFNVGDKVRVAGHPHAEGEGLILSPGGANDPRGWYWTNVDDGRWVGMVHIRNLDPVVEDERRGAPRPKPVDGEDVIAVLTVPFQWGRFHSLTIQYKDAEIRQIERRKENKGREARKS